MMADEILSLLRCPENRSTLEPADAELVRQVNDAIAAGRLHSRAGRRVEKQIDGGFVRAAGDVMYPIVDQIPVMLIDESIPLDQLKS